MLCLEREFEVEQLVDRKRQAGKVLFYVKWVGFPSSSNTWEELSSLPDNMIKGYEKRYGLLSPPAKRGRSKKDGDEDNSDETESPKKKNKKTTPQQRTKVYYII